jgi:hypothetical protein
MFNVAVVAEGPTDVHVLEAILDVYLPDGYLLRSLQPDMSLFGGEAGHHGGGWKGVRSWCADVAAAGGLEAVNALAADVNLLVIHVDADIAKDTEVDVFSPCPPPEATVLPLEKKVLSWLRLDELPDRVALWIPAMATEALLLRAFFPDARESASCAEADPASPCVECIDDPARALLQRNPRFVQMKHDPRKNRRILKKKTAEYRNQRKAIATRWNDLVESCWSARHLHDRLKVFV